jgi:hypothetical protein
MGADADPCRSLSCFPQSNVIKGWWTSCQLLKLGSSRLIEERDGAGTGADSGAGSGGSRHISLHFLFFSFLFSLFWSVFKLSFVSGDEGYQGGELHHLAG